MQEVTVASQAVLHPLGERQYNDIHRGVDAGAVRARACLGSSPLIGVFRCA